MFKTDAYARILCSKCNEQVDTLMPGQIFNGIKECKKCSYMTRPIPKKIVKKAAPKTEEK